MNLHHRPYSSELGDFERVFKFLVHDYADRQQQFTWLASRFGDWKYGLWDYRKYFPPFFPRNAHLWLDEFHELKGFVISEAGDASFMVFTRRGFASLANEMLDWVCMNWRGRANTLKTEVHEYQGLYSDMLESHGFRKVDEACATYQYDLSNDWRQPALPPGYRIVDMLENPDWAGKRRLQVNAFRNEADISELDLLAYEYSRDCPCYDAAFDLSVVDAEGNHLSACVGFLDHENRIAEVERVCTHGLYRRRGLAEAVIRACFERLKDAGYQHAYIQVYSTDANSLYSRLGASRTKRWHLYELTNGLGI